jgi:Domain of unknown function (DUF5667)
MTGHRDPNGGGFTVPQEYADIAERVTRRLSSYSIDPATRARHLYHLRELAATQPLPTLVHGRVDRWWRRVVRRVATTAAASLAAVMLSGSAIAAAAQTALPGDPLYEAKRFVERVELATAWTPQGKVAVRLVHANVRLEETERLVDGGITNPELLEFPLTDIKQNLKTADNIAGDDKGLKRQVAASATKASARLEPIADAPLPEATSKSAHDALMTAQRVASMPGAYQGPNVDEKAPGSRPRAGSGPSGMKPRGGGSDSLPMPMFPQMPEMPPMPSGTEFPSVPPYPSTPPGTETGGGQSDSHGFGPGRIPQGSPSDRSQIGPDRSPGFSEGQVPRGSSGNDPRGSRAQGPRGGRGGRPRFDQGDSRTDDSRTIDEGNRSGFGEESSYSTERPTPSFPSIPSSFASPPEQMASTPPSLPDSGSRRGPFSP